MDAPKNFVFSHISQGLKLIKEIISYSDEVKLEQISNYARYLIMSKYRFRENPTVWIDVNKKL